MRMVTEKIDQSSACPDAEATLPYDLRIKSRLRLTLDSGEPIGFLLPRGTVLRGGDFLRDEMGRFIRINAAPEQVSTVLASSSMVLARIAYHLGNRHVPVQVGDGWLRYASDHVLDHMVRGLGGEITTEAAPFEPEDGAYAHSHSAALVD